MQEFDAILVTYSSITKGRCHAGIGSLVIYIVGAARKSYDRRTKL